MALELALPPPLVELLAVDWHITDPTITATSDARTVDLQK
jgi:hypothetical protein